MKLRIYVMHNDYQTKQAEIEIENRENGNSLMDAAAFALNEMLKNGKIKDYRVELVK